MLFDITAWQHTYDKRSPFFEVEIYCILQCGGVLTRKKLVRMKRRGMSQRYALRMIGTNVKISVAINEVLDGGERKKEKRRGKMAGHKLSLRAAA